MYILLNHKCSFCTSSGLCDVGSTNIVFTKQTCKERQTPFSIKKCKTNWTILKLEDNFYRFFALPFFKPKYTDK